MSNVVFLQTVNIKFAMHGHAVDFWFMFTSPVLKRFCSLTQLNTSCRYSYTANFKRNPKKERMRGQVTTLTQTVRNENCRDVVFKAVLHYSNEPVQASTCTFIEVFFSQKQLSQNWSFPLVIQDMPLDFIRQIETLHVARLGLAWQIVIDAKVFIICSRESFTPPRERSRNTLT